MDSRGDKLFIRKGWLESDSGKYVLAVTRRPFAYGDAPRAVRVGHVVIVQDPAVDEPEFSKECLARIEQGTGMIVEAFGWESAIAASRHG